MAKNLWTADRRLYLDKDGKAVEADDPTRTRLLVAQGATLPLEEAERLGLVTAPAPPAAVEAPQAEEKAKPPAPNKARGPAPNKSEA